ncbi:MAG: virulence factor [Rhodobacteraceae bacterium]|nr:virulence factor [Paracoccaceae bacterium]
MNLRANVGHNSGERRPMYAIAFDLDTATLKASYHNDSWQNAYNDVGRALRSHGFDRTQGAVCFGNDNVDAVTCVLAVQQLTSEFAWFGPAVRDIRMLRIEDNNGLRPAVERALAMKR